MSKKEINRLKQVRKVKLQVLEIAMIVIALESHIAYFTADDKAGRYLLKAYEGLCDRLRKECRE